MDTKAKSSRATDTLRAHYDFRTGVRGKHAAKYAKGTNVVLIDPSVMDVFPNSEAVNETLRAIAPLLRSAARRAKSQAIRNKSKV